MLLAGAGRQPVHASPLCQAIRRNLSVIHDRYLCPRPASDRETVVDYFQLLA